MNKALLILFSVLFTFTLLTPVFALSYRGDVDNGSWSQFNDELVNTVYRQDATLGQGTYNRDFADSFTFVTETCDEEWCVTEANVGVSWQSEVLAGALHQSATGGGASTEQIFTFANNEVVSDSNVFLSYFDYTETDPPNAYASAGVVDDQNNYTELVAFSVNGAVWTDINMTVPKGNYKIAIETRAGGAGNTSDVTVDNIRVIRNNTGTFRANNEPEFCSSIQSCSNIDIHLPSNELGSLYHVVGYVAGGNCSYRLNKPLSDLATGGSIFASDGYLTEGLSGMYYFEIENTISSYQYEDLNIEVFCTKTGVSSKGFFVQPQVNKFGNVSNGNFETSFDLTSDGECEDSWCFDRIASSGSYVIGTSASLFEDGLNYLDIYTVGDTAVSETSGVFGTDDVQGTTVSLWFRYAEDGGANDSAQYGYSTDANVFTMVGDLVVGTDWNYVEFAVPSGQIYHPFFRVNASGVTYAHLQVDNISYSGAKQDSTIDATNDLVDDYGLKGTEYNFYSDYENIFGNDIVDGDCNLTVGASVYPMVYSSGNSRFEYAYTFTSNGEFSISHDCSSDNFNDATDSYTATIVTPSSQIVTIGDLVNVSSFNLSDFSNDLNFNIQDHTKAFEFSIIVQEDYTINYGWLNNLLNSNQYFISTSSDGVNWVFSDSLTFGSSDTNYNDPIQKVRASTRADYYSYSDILSSGVKRYYKLTFLGPARAWETIRSSSDWINVNSPSYFEDLKDRRWDLFSDSNYSNILSHTSVFYPDLTSTDLNTGFEFQFNAYASEATTLKVGYRVNGADTVVNVAISADETRYSVPVDPTSNNSYIVIKSTDLDDVRVYLSQYALLPKSYFVDRLEVKTVNNQDLPAIVNNGSSVVYIGEGIPFRVQTSFYDVGGDLATLRIEALIGDVSLKTYEFDLTEDAEDGQKTFIDELIDGVVDLNGWYKNPASFRDLTIKATLIDTSGNEVSEQRATVKILQYPYFQNDLFLNVFTLGTKVASNPEFRLEFQQTDPDRFLGIKIYIYDENGSVSNPNYSETIWADELNCSFSCVKNILINSWVWEKATPYNVDFLILLNTENEHLDSELTYKNFSVIPTYRTFETARIFQVFERTDMTYRNDEKIPLVLQLRDIPYRSLIKDLSVYMTVTICPNPVIDTDCVTQINKFAPSKFVYDETTGYNYFYWDKIFFESDGDLIGDGNYLEFTAFIDDKSESHDSSVIPSPGLADKCGDDDFGTLFLNSWFNMYAVILPLADRALYGCGTDANAIVDWDSPDAVRILIDEDHSVSGGQNHSLVCLNTDQNNNYVNNLEQDIFCLVWFKKDEQGIDEFQFAIGNEYSDYSLDPIQGQYIDFGIPAEQIIFNDPIMLKQALNTEYSTDSIDTLGEVAYYAFDRMFSGIANPLTDVIQGTGQASGIITNYNFDLNWDHTFDPNLINGIFLIKVKGLKVINQYDYISSFPELEVLDPTYFTRFAGNNGIRLPEKTTLVEIVGNDLKPIFVERVDSQLIIFAEPSTNTIDGKVQADTNVNISVVPKRFKFNFIADMISNNSSSMARIFLPLQFTYVVPDNTPPYIALLALGFEFLTDPVGAGLKYWFWFVIIIMFVLVVSVVYKNLKGGGNIIVNTENPGGV